MLIVLSPAKRLDVASAAPVTQATQPRFVDEAKTLIAQLRRYGPDQIAELMSLSDALAALNVARYASWTPSFDAGNAKQAVYMFAGDVYDGLQAHALDAHDLAYAQDRLRILSGLYGVLRPLDYMQPYRLEMGTRLNTRRGKDLYAFWGKRIAQCLRDDLASLHGAPQVIVNCASNEYFKAVHAEALGATILTPVFEERTDRGWKIVSFHAKRARGMMARYAIRHRIEDPEALKGFDAAGYAFDPAASDAYTWRFRRAAAPESGRGARMSLQEGHGC